MAVTGVICDGNVKRVLTRWAGIDGDITKTATTKALWQLAERLTPTRDSGHYAQAMMDMGATLYQNQTCLPTVSRANRLRGKCPRQAKFLSGKSKNPQSV